MSGIVHISCGSYDRAITGFELNLEECSEGTPATMTRKYGTAAHGGPVRCIASAGNILASGGDDEIIRLYDISKMIEIGTVMHQEASITHIDFGKNIMLSAADDGTIALWLLKDWSHLCTLKGHKGKITGLAVHPSGLLALSLGVDRSLCMWDLVAKKKVLTIKAKSNSSLLRWSPSGGQYMVVCGQEVRTFNSNGDLVSTFQNPCKIVSICFLAETQAAIGGDDGVIRIWETTENGRQLHELSHHKSRVSALDAVRIPNRLLLASTSSDGSVAVWDFDRQPIPQVVAVADAKLRVTSMCSVNASKLDSDCRS